MGFIKRIWEFFFNNCMWLYIIMGLLSIIGVYVYTYQLLMLISVLYLIVLVPRLRYTSSLDLFVILYLFYIIINSLLIDYPNHFSLWYKDAIFSILPITCFFIAKTTDYGIEKLISKMTLPLTIAMLIGVFFYFYNPPWYSAIKYAQLHDFYGYSEGNIPEKTLREAFRLSSVWVTPYVIGYANAVFLAFLTSQLLFTPQEVGKWKIMLLFLLSFVVMILAGFKSVLLFFVLFICWSFYLSNQSKQKSRFIVWGVLLLLFVVLFFSTNTDYSEYFIERFKEATSEEGLSERLDHTGGGVELGTLFGNGFGRYGISAKSLGQFSIQDSQYQKVLAELGIFGFTLFILMLLSALLHSFRKRKLILEFGIILFYTISFIGSSSISAETTFAFVFWYAMGSISKNNRKDYLVRTT